MRKWLEGGAIDRKQRKGKKGATKLRPSKTASTASDEEYEIVENSGEQLANAFVKLRFIQSIGQDNAKKL